MGDSQVDPGDLIDPADVDWSAAEDTLVWQAALAGVPQAVAEAARRNDTRPSKARQAVADYRAKRGRKTS